MRGHHPVIGFEVAPGTLCQERGQHVYLEEVRNAIIVGAARSGKKHAIGSVAADEQSMWGCWLPSQQRPSCVSCNSKLRDAAASEAPLLPLNRTGDSREQDEECLDICGATMRLHMPAHSATAILHRPTPWHCRTQLLGWRTARNCSRTPPTGLLCLSPTAQCNRLPQAPTLFTFI